MKVFRGIVYGALILGILGLLAYQCFVTGDLDTADITRAGLILAGVVFSLVRPQRKTTHTAGKKALYQKAYGEFIRNVFSEDPKLERKFYSAIADYNNNQPEAGVKKLMALRAECHRTDDLYAVTVFTGLCLDDMGLYEEAANAYENSLRIRPNASIASNLGLCYQHLGRPEDAMQAYEHSIGLNPDNPYVYNNIASMYFREGDYETALDYAEHALDCNPGLKEALGTACMCFALIGDKGNYQEYYRRAVAAGQDGKKLKAKIKELDPTL